MKIIVIGLFLIILFGCKQASVQFMGEIEKQWKSDSVEVVLCGARRGERLFVAPIREDGTFLLSGNISSNKLVFINFPKDYMRIPVYVEKNHYILVESEDKYYALSEKPSLQNQYVEFQKELDVLNRDYEVVYQGYDTITDIHRKAARSELLDKKFTKKNELVIEGIRKFAGTEIAQNLIYEILFYCEVDFRFFTRAIEALGDSIPNSGMKTKIFDTYNRIKAKQLIGQAPDFELPDVKGRKVNLTDFRGKHVLLDFWASWCAPCRMVVPIIEEIAGERPDIKVGKINVDEQPELASKFGIMSIPTLVVMKNGKIVQQVSGARPKNAILEML